MRASPIKTKLGLICLLGFYTSLALIQPLLHTHAAEQSSQVHIHLERGAHEHDHADHLQDSGHDSHDDHAHGWIEHGEGLASPGHIHLALDGSPIGVSHTLQKISCRIAPAAASLPSIPSAETPPPLEMACLELDFAISVRYSPHLITSLTDLSPPLA